MLKLNNNAKKLEIINRVDLIVSEIERRIDWIEQLRQQGITANLLLHLDEVQNMVNDTKLLMKEVR